MKSRIFRTLFKTGIMIFPLLLPYGLVSCAGEEKEASIDIVEKYFTDPEGQTDIAVYWYWLNDNISEEGVVKDLDAMKRAGITRAYIGFQGIDDIPQGKVPFESEEWWKILKTTLRHAGEIGIDIGIFNSPGWSQSGGPWVTPEQSMKYIESASVIAEGNREKQTIALPEIEGAIDDIAVIAYQDTEDYLSLNAKEFKKDESPLTVNLYSYRPVTVRSLEITVDSVFRTTGKLEAKKGEGWQTLREFPVERYNSGLNVGFKPFAPIVIAVPETTASEFRLTLNGGVGNVDILLTGKPRLEFYAEKSMAKMFQEPLPLWGDYMWDRQPDAADSSHAIASSGIKVLTDSVNDAGKLEWCVPDGTWNITVFKSKPTGVTNTPAMPDARGLEIDKMSRRIAGEHFDAFIGEILRRIPETERRSLRYVVSDSYEVGGQNWTEDFIDSFKKKYGYDPVPFMPALNGDVVDSRDASDRFLWDMRRLIADRLADDYIVGLKEKANENGLKLWLENYGHWGYTGEFLQYGGRADEVSGEFWSEGNLGDIENRGASSCAHIYGKNIVWSESCTSGVPAFSRYPALMKQRVDRFFTEGINSTLLHLYIQQPEDCNGGLSAWFGNEFNRNNVWFSQLDVFLLYLKRCNYMLQQGRYIADIAYFIGEDTPKMTGVCSPEPPYGYSFDFINAEILKGHARVRNGKLCLDSGMEYSVLVLPEQTTMRPELLSKIKEFVKDGLTITGPAPETSPSLENYPAADKAVKADAALLWNNPDGVSAYGKGKVWRAGTSLEEIFNSLGISPDFNVAQGEYRPLFIHRKLKDAEIYFISNQTDSVQTIDGLFRVDDPEYAAQLWNPVTGEISSLPEVGRNVPGTAEVRFRLDPVESCFIVFRNTDKKSGFVSNIPQTEEITSVNGPWICSFNPALGGPSAPVTVTELKPLNLWDNDSIKYYSGATVYKSSFNLPATDGNPIYIDLGEVMVMGKVKINDIYAGGVWTHPYSLNITGLVREGENSIEIETVNNWKNRMIFDDALPIDKRLTRSNQWNFKSTDELQKSGLVGPVRILKRVK